MNDERSPARAPVASPVEYQHAGFTARFGVERHGWGQFYELGVLMFVVALVGLGFQTGSLLAVGVALGLAVGAVVAAFRFAPELTSWRLRLAAGGLTLTRIRGPVPIRTELPVAGSTTEVRDGHLHLRARGRAWRLPLTGWDATAIDGLCVQLAEHASSAERRLEAAPLEAQALLDRVRRPEGLPVPWADAQSGALLTLKPDGFLARFEGFAAPWGWWLPSLIRVVAIVAMSQAGTYLGSAVCCGVLFGSWFLHVLPPFRTTTLTLAPGSVTLEVPGLREARRVEVPLAGLTATVRGDRLVLEGPAGRWGLPTGGWEPSALQQVCDRLGEASARVLPPHANG